MAAYLGGVGGAAPLSGEDAESTSRSPNGGDGTPFREVVELLNPQIGRELPRRESERPRRSLPQRELPDDRPRTTGLDPECNWCAKADLLNNVLRNKRTMVLKPGQGFVLHGVVAELHWNADGLSTCSRANNNTVRLGNGDDDQCSMSLPVTTYSY